MWSLDQWISIIWNLLESSINHSASTQSDNRGGAQHSILSSVEDDFMHTKIENLKKTTVLVIFILSV